MLFVYPDAESDDIFIYSNEDMSTPVATLHRHKSWDAAALADVFTASPQLLKVCQQLLAQMDEKQLNMPVIDYDDLEEAVAIATNGVRK